MPGGSGPTGRAAFSARHTVSGRARLPLSPGQGQVEAVTVGHPPAGRPGPRGLPWWWLSQKGWAAGLLLTPHSCLPSREAGAQGLRAPLAEPGGCGQPSLGGCGLQDRPLRRSVGRLPRRPQLVLAAQGRPTVPRTWGGERGPGPEGGREGWGVAGRQWALCPGGPAQAPCYPGPRNRLRSPGRPLPAGEGGLRDPCPDELGVGVSGESARSPASVTASVKRRG